MKRVLRFFFILASFFSVFSCTNYKDENLLNVLSVDTNELVITSKGEINRVLIVCSGSEWEVASMPEWISVQSIDIHSSPFEWLVRFSAEENNEYNREGVVVLKTKSESVDIKVTQEGRKGKYVAVESVSLSPDKLSSRVGDTQRLIATISPSNATDKSVIWSSSNTSVATVSSSGIITAITSGTATITVKTNDGGKSADCIITVSEECIAFTDKIFKAYCIERFDTSGDGEISYDEARAVTSIGVDYCGITSLHGLQYFTNLTVLHCDDNYLTDLDVSGCTALTELSCCHNQLTSLNVSNNAALTNLRCATNRLTSIDVSKNTALTNLFCSSNQLTSLDVSYNSALTGLGCSINLLSTLDVSNNTALKELVCYSNQLTSLDVSNNTALTNLSCSANPYLKEIWLRSGQTISHFDYDKNVATIKYKPEAVDLGLPSGLKWASFNLGATTPEEYGDAYAWGEIETKTVYDWSTYKWCNGTQTSLTKYNTSDSYGLVDNKTQLEPEDDVARIKLGSKWRIPTHAEIQELVKSCTFSLSTLNGVKGYVATSRINGNSIFFPMAEDQGNYVSDETVQDLSISIYKLMIKDDGVYPNAYSRRCWGYWIRPVYEE